jgi:hypothetical protein
LVKIDKHISDLLQDHDCVIVPKMGGFLSSQAPKGIYSGSTSNLGPKISFNVLLKYNDGLLANHIAKNDSLSYDEALEEIEKFVELYQNEVNSGKKFIIDRVGVLYKDDDSIVHIEPYRNEIQSDNSVSSVNNFFEEVKQSPISPPVIPLALPVKRKRSFFKSNIFVFILFLSGIIYVFYLFEYSNSHQQKDLQSIDSVDLMQEENPSAVTNNVSKTPPNETKSASDVSSNTTNRKSTASDLNSNSISNKPSGDRVIDTKAADLSTTEESKLKMLQGNISGPYFIIAGSFKSIDNANSKLNELKSKGFKNASIFSDNRNLQMVSYDQFKTSAEASEFLKKIKAEHKDAWIYGR